MEVLRSRGITDLNATQIAAVEAGFDDLNKVIEADEGQLLTIIRDSEQVTNLQEAIARYLERTSGSLLAWHSQRSKKFSLEVLIRRVYESVGKDFEVSVYELLRAASVDVRLLDEKKVPGCADLLLISSKGNVQIECKTKKDGKGQVTNTEAFEVMGKTHVGEQPIAYVTVGKPSFVEPAIKNSHAKRVTLVTHQTVCEAVIQILEGKREKTDLEGLFLSRRYVETSEFR